MDRLTQQQDIVRVLDFTEKLLEFLLTLVPPHRSAEYRNVWQSDVKPKLQSVRSELMQLTTNSHQFLRLDDVGWNPDSARLKAEAIREQSEKGALATTIRLTNSALSSLKIVFLGLEPPKEFKDYLETWAENRAEPEPYITTLFGPGPIPSPSQRRPVTPPKTGRRIR